MEIVRKIVLMYFVETEGLTVPLRIENKSPTSSKDKKPHKNLFD